ncbi:MAG: FAD-binding oxidoreductase [Candidatus Omnitrophica bacterium]|jgi:D-lactate dehydrogenase (cytochrome)|nr:FAD-binding oxidoreductase [Candidatus Omnitrophota bacterium]
MFIKDKTKDLLNYLEDTSNIKGTASLLYLPQDKQEVSSVFQEITRKKTPLTISSGRTGTTGGCVPYDGAIISSEKLNKINNIDVEKNIIDLESGVSLESLEKEVNKLGLTLSASPTESLALIGGAISTSASGVRGFGYGSIRNYVIEIEVFLTSGEIIRIKRGEFFSQGRNFDFQLNNKRFIFKLPSYNLPKVKSQAGYYIKDNMDLIDLFIGSEGTLGFIFSSKILLQKKPFNLFDGLLFFLREEDAFTFVDTIKELKNNMALRPVSLEFFDKNSLESLKEQYTFVPESEAAIYFEQDAKDEKEYNFLIDKWQNLITKSSALLDKSIFADTLALRKKVFEFRHSLPQMINEYLRQNKQLKAATDIAVPDSKFSQMYTFYKKIAVESGINYLNFGHIGESHLHFNFLPRNIKEAEKAKEYLRIFCQKAVSLGGTISAEHGIGKIKKSYLDLMYDKEQIQQMATLKKYFDPYCLLGLDNIFDKKLLKQPSA